MNGLNEEKSERSSGCRYICIDCLWVCYRNG
jgi:hypothetical protein